MKKLKRLLLGLAAISATTLLYSCEEAEEDLIKEAQVCLNSAPASEALNCVNKITSNTTAAAYGLRCSAAFISQNMGDIDEIINALKDLGNSGGSCAGGCSPVVDVIKVLKFSSRSTADYAFSNCVKADAKIYAQLASLVKIGSIVYTRAAAHSSPSEPNQDDFDYVLTISNGQFTAQDITDVGGVVSATYGIICTQAADKQSDSTKQFCEKLKVAIDAGSTDNDIGTCFVRKLADPSYSSGACI